MKKYVIMTPIWKRPMLTDYVFRYYSRLQSALAPEIDLRLIAVGSEGDRSRRIAERNGYEYIEYENMPRNRKLNAASRWSKRYEPDALITIGSDDIVNANYFRNIRPLPDTAIGLLDLYFLNFHTRKLGYWPGHKEDWRQGEPIGMGRCYSREVLDRCEWQPWSQDKALMKSLDINARRKLTSLGVKMKGFKMEELECFAMDVKMEHNLWPWSTYEYEKIIENEDLCPIFESVGVSDIFDLKDPDKDPLEPLRYEMHHRGHQVHTPLGAMEILRLKINKDSRVLETGAGMSTIWFAGHAASIESFEHDEKWFKFVKDELRSRDLNNVNLHFDPGYPERGLGSLKDKFDIIFIDGRGRVRSILTSAKHLKPGGFILLDDAERDYYAEGKGYLDSLGWARMRFKSTKAGKYALGWIRSYK